ncbi:MAG: ABC transporter permease subunit [Spirochaetes bacterium]|jgi:raffinose/stachyose/melibiose transport system permease protein|nr:ABC transporter permease subunit [Spirochaetota bacterium]
MIRVLRRHALEAIMVFLLIAYLYPFVIVTINSAKDAFSVTQFPMRLPENWGQILVNMETIWTSQNIRYSSSFLSSVLITAFSLVAVTIFPAMAGWVLVRTKTRTSQILFLLFVAAMVIPFQIVMFPLISWFRTIFQVIGIRLLRTYLGIVLAYLGFGLSLSVFMYHGFIKAIPFELEEASIIDGASLPEVFFRIIFPLLTPVHATIAILHGIWIWNDFLLPLLVLGKGNRIQTLPLAVANFAGAYVKQWDLILTAILMAMIPVIVFFFAAQKKIIKGMVAGSIK